MFFASFKIKYLIGFLILSGGAIWWAHHAGQQVADKQLERLSVVWPEVKFMSQKERGMLTSLVWVCKLGNSEQSTEAVIHCLQSATKNNDLSLPKSMTREKLIRRFQELRESPRPVFRANYP